MRNCEAISNNRFVIRLEYTIPLTNGYEKSLSISVKILSVEKINKKMRVIVSL